MQTRREYLAGLNPPLATMGRGRLSAEAHAKIDEMLAQGMKFSDVKSTGNSDKPVTSKDASKANHSGEFFGETPARIWNGGWYRVDKGKRIDVSGAAACGKCRYSLDYQGCEDPTAVDNIGRLVPVYRKMAG